MSAPTALLANTSPAVLMNKGFPAEFVLTRKDDSGVYERNPGGETKTQWIALDMEKLHAIESRWGTLEAWETALNSAMVTTLVSTLGIILGWPEQRVMKSMRNGGIAEYRLAVSGAYALALGRDPKEVKKALMTAEGDAEDPPETPTGPVSDSWETTEPSSGQSFGPVGSVTDTTPTGFGDSVSDSASPTSSQWH